MFCDDCGNLLEANSSTQKTKLTCEVCHAECEGICPFPENRENAHCVNMPLQTPLTR